VAHTVKGKGVSFMENDPEWHGKRPSPTRRSPPFARCWASPPAPGRTT
jgi:hypothetical protein